jgi:hypothetical protein
MQRRPSGAGPRDEQSPPTSWSYEPSTQMPSRDTERAKATSTQTPQWHGRASLAGAMSSTDEHLSGGSEQPHSTSDGPMSDDATSPFPTEFGAAPGSVRTLSHSKRQASRTLSGTLRGEEQLSPLAVQVRGALHNTFVPRMSLLTLLRVRDRYLLRSTRTFHPTPLPLETAP